MRFDASSAVVLRRVNVTNTVDHQGLEHRLDELTSLVRQLAMGKTQQPPARVCGICSLNTHATDACPTLQEETNPQAFAAGIFPGKPQPRYDPYSNFYNPGWKDHPNLRYSNPAAHLAPHQQPNYHPSGPSNRPTFQQPYPTKQSFPQHITPPAPQPTIPAPKTEPSLEDLVKTMATNSIQFQQRTETTIQNLETQIGQLASSLSELKSQGSSHLPSQTIKNPKNNVSAIILRSGREVENPSQP